MSRVLPSVLIAAAAALVTVLAPAPAAAVNAQDDTYEPDKGVNPVQTTRDRFKMAVNDAEVAFRKNMAQCETMAPSDKAECIRAANDQHDSDLARADDFRRRPS